MDTPIQYPWLSRCAILWLLVYVPAYASTYGLWHFLFLCNLGLLITVTGLVLGNQLLISSQAVSAPVIGILWTIDVISKLMTGRFIHAGTAYMWDASVPVLTRTLSLYHVGWPVLTLYCLAKHGYDRRGWLVQSILAAVVFVIGLYIAPPSENLNYVHHWPGGRVVGGGASQHALISLLILVFALYWPLHRLQMRAFKKADDPVAFAPKP